MKEISATIGFRGSSTTTVHFVGTVSGTTLREGCLLIACFCSWRVNRLNKHHFSRYIFLFFWCQYTSVKRSLLGEEHNPISFKAKEATNKENTRTTTEDLMCCFCLKDRASQVEDIPSSSTSCVSSRRSRSSVVRIRYFQQTR